MWDFSWASRSTKKYYRKEKSIFYIIGTRLAIILILLLIVAYIFWIFEKNHIHDDTGGEFSYIDSLYFTVVTVTTLGYGDIVPTSEEARMFDTLIITPVRIAVWVLFIGTAYQLVIQNNWERFKMNRALKKMKGHVIVAGYGTTGAAAIDELIHKGYNEDNLVVLDTSEERIRSAAEVGVTGILGDPTKEESLINAGIRNAGILIVATHQDDTNVLITLTAKDLNPKIKLISRVSQLENIKQLKRAGADVIISPSLTSGNLMAMAVGNSNHVELVGELLTTSRGVNVIQRKVNASEIGQAPKALKKCVVIGAVRNGKNIGPRELDGLRLKKGDEIILIG